MREALTTRQGNEARGKIEKFPREHEQGKRTSIAREVREKTSLARELHPWPRAEQKRGLEMCVNNLSRNNPTDPNRIMIQQD